VRRPVGNRRGERVAFTPLEASFSKKRSTAARFRLC